MKTKLLYCFLAFSLIGRATEEKKVPSTIDKVTVFLNGAQIERSGSTILEAGRNKIHFTGLPLSLDNKSLQFSTNAPITILSINHQISYVDESKKDSLRIKSLQKNLKKLGEDAELIESTYAIYHQEKQVLANNSNFRSSETGISVVELEKGVNLVRNRLLEIDKKLLALDLEKETINTQKQQIRNKLELYRNKSAVKSGEVIVVLNCDKTMKAELNLNYTVNQASWKPYYDLKVKDVNSPLKLVYKAKVAQNSGENWDKAKITLSTGDPSQGGQIPALAPWFLNYTNQRYTPTGPKTSVGKPGITGEISGVVVNPQNGEAVYAANIVAINNYGEIIQGTTTGFDGKFKMNLKRPAQRLEISFVGFRKDILYLNAQNRYYRINLNATQRELEEVIFDREREAPSQSSGMVIQEDVIQMASRSVESIDRRGFNNYSGRRLSFDRASNDKKNQNAPFIISRNPTTFNFTVTEPYDIPSDGNDYVVTLQEFSLDADYLYKATPKLEENAYLTASLTKWEQLSLRNGEAGIYYEGVYMGETYLDVESAGDTLQISLGKDEDIVVSREEIVSKEDVRFISSNKEESFHYRVSIRNNKQGKIRLHVTDQFPLSANNKIKVKEQQNDKGEVILESGFIIWKLELEPSKSENLNIKYNVVYPKNKIINLN